MLGEEQVRRPGCTSLIKICHHARQYQTFAEVASYETEQRQACSVILFFHQSGVKNLRRSYFLIKLNKHFPSSVCSREAVVKGLMLIHMLHSVL